MDTRYLESFIVICEHGSFAEAARRMNLTSAALSARIRTLEDEVGTPLITRAGRSARPTEAGLKILERAKSILKEVRDISALANNDEHLGEYRLGVATSTLAELTPALLRKLYAIYPTLRVYVESGASTYLYGRVVSRDIDIAIIAEPVQLPPKGFQWEPIKEERLVLIAPARLRHADPHSLLRTEPFLRFNRSARGGQIAETYLRRHGIVPRERLEIDMLDTIAYLVRDDMGVSLIPDWAPGWLDHIGVARIALPRNSSVRNMGLFWDANGVNSPLVDTTLSEVRKLAAIPLEAR